MENKINIKFRLWFYTGEDKLVGKGRIELLERIKESGSIAQSAKAMKMSYRQAWQMVKEMNERSDSPFVRKQHGGKKGGGANLTEAGERAIQNYHELEQKIRELISSEKDKIKF